VRASRVIVESLVTFDYEITLLTVRTATGGSSKWCSAARPNT